MNGLTPKTLHKKLKHCQLKLGMTKKNFRTQRNRNDVDEHMTLERRMMRAGVTVLSKLVCVLLI